MTTMLIDRIRIKELEETLANSTALLAVVGAGDLAVEKLRAARDELAGRAATFDPKAFRDQAQARVAGRVDALQAEVLHAPEQIRALPERAQEWPAKAQSLLADVVSAAFATYGDLAGRGKSRVTQIRRDVPDAVRVDADVTPVSRPASSTLRTRPVAKRTAAQKTAARKTATAKTATAKTASTTKPAARKTVRKTATTKKATTTAKASTTPSSAAQKTPSPAKKAAGTDS